jgi:site-specific DNA-methyltransferase (adenine-specific)
MPRPPVVLSWPGKPSRSEPEAPTRTGSLRVVEKGHPSCHLVEGDNLGALRALADRAPESVTLAYLDPPFLTGKQHDSVQRSKDAKTGKILREVSPAFDDRWASLSEYLAVLGDRVSEVRRLLCDAGSLVLHVDSKTSHYAKVLCDEIFGMDCFMSEIIWRYRRWPAKTKNFQRVHDVMLRYVKNPESTPRFNQLYEPLAPSTLATWGTRKQRAVVGSDGRRQRSSKTDSDTPGAPLGDVWDIGIVAPVSKERTGYPTQKPEALLERLIAALTEPGDLVLDPYMGSGTSLVVAQRLDRRSIGIDSGAEAFRVTRERLAQAGIEPLVERLGPGLRRTNATARAAQKAS